MTFFLFALGMFLLCNEDLNLPCIGVILIFASFISFLLKRKAATNAPVSPDELVSTAGLAGSNGFGSGVDIGNLKIQQSHAVVIDSKIHYFTYCEFADIIFRTSATIDESLLRDFVMATISDIERYGIGNYSLCPRCQGFVFHPVGAKYAGSCGCGQSFELVGKGNVGKPRGFEWPSTYY